MFLTISELLKSNNKEEVSPGDLRIKTLEEIVQNKEKYAEMADISLDEFINTHADAIGKNYCNTASWGCSVCLETLSRSLKVAGYRSNWDR